MHFRVGSPENQMINTFWPIQTLVSVAITKNMNETINQIK